LSGDSHCELIPRGHPYIDTETTTMEKTVVCSTLREGRIDTRQLL